MPHTTLVLGAGSSRFLGYPLGSQLRAKIVELTNADRLEFTIRAGLMADQNELYSFVDAFRFSQMYSIDAFLARRPEYSNIGKRAISAILLEAEGSSRLERVEDDDHWYRYLLNELCRTQIENIATGSVAVVTFNYDRSLEAYLFQSIQGVFGVNAQVAAKTLAEIRIVHVYGSLGSPIPGTSDFLPYGGGVDQAAVNAAARRVQVIPEGRDDSPALSLARETLLNASSIAFLGFGFDELNLTRLHSRVTCADFIQRADGRYSRQIHATCLGMTAAEASRAHAQLGATVSVSRSADGFPHSFRPVGCLRLLRETLVLRDV